MDVRVGLWRRLSAEELMLLNCGVGEDPWESLGLQGDPTSPFWRRSALGFLWRKWCWSWNSCTLATSWEELTYWKRFWCWEGLGAGGEGDNRGWDGWMASLTRWTWVWVNSGSLWWTGRPGGLRFMGSQRVRHDWATELNWMLLTEMKGKGGEIGCDHFSEGQVRFLKWNKKKSRLSVERQWPHLLKNAIYFLYYCLIKFSPVSKDKIISYDLFFLRLIVFFIINEENHCLT